MGIQKRDNSGNGYRFHKTSVCHLLGVSTAGPAGGGENWESEADPECMIAAAGFPAQ